MVFGVPPMPAGSTAPMIQAAQIPQLMAIYALGFITVFVILCLLCARAWRVREALGLDPRERYLTRVYLRSHGLAAGVGLLALVLALTGTGWGSMLSGFS